MRLATWNLDAVARPGAVELLLSLDADVLLLTEVPPGFALPDYEIAPSPHVMRRGQAWAAVASRRPLQPLAPPHPASAAAVVDGVTCVSTVLPWKGAPQEPWTGATLGERTVACVAQLAPFLAAQPELVWGGDWNHTMAGGYAGGSRAGRDRIEQALTALDLHLPTRDLPRGPYQMGTIDHLAVRDAAATAEHVPVPRRLSDHDAYAVTVG